MTSLQKFSYTNRAGMDMRITVEPWAEQFVIRPGQTIDVVVAGGVAGGCLELEQVADGLIIYGYEGTTVHLTSNGEELTPAVQK
jgi:hypothetical protein